MKTLLLILSCLFSSILFAQKLEFSELSDIKKLNIKQEQHSQSINKQFETVKFNVSTSDLSILQDNEFDNFHLTGARTSGNTGEPSILILSEKIKFEKEVTITGIELIKGSYVEIINEINLSPRKEPVTWGNIDDCPSKERPISSIYNKNELFPGKSFSYLSGSNGKNTEVYLTFYPIQFNPIQKKAYLLTNAEFKIYYQDNITKTNNQHPEFVNYSKGIILTTDSFATASNTLKTIHETQQDITTEIVTAEWIDSVYSPAEDPTIEGIANIPTTYINDSYNYTLAKKIVAYLRDQNAHPNLESITILGDANIIPPSYYFYLDRNGNRWTCSDLFYSSPDYDFCLNYEIGRIPVQTEIEAQNFVNKVLNWTNNLSEDWFKNVHLLGGSTFDSRDLVGEAITIDAVNRNYFRGMNITKNFASNGTFNKTEVLPLFSNENTGIIFHDGHGYGTAMPLGQGIITNEDLMSLPSKTKYPILVSSACVNAMYDTELLNENLFDNCFAECLLKSNAGGIGYYGGVRINYGAPEIYFKDNGEWIIGEEPYMVGMLCDVFKAYSEGSNSLGQIAKSTTNIYLSKMDPDNIVDWATLYAFVFLGDPVLKVLPQQPENISEPSMSVSSAPDFYGGYEPPVYYFSDLDSLNLSFSAITNSEYINQKLVDVTDNGITNLLDTNKITEPYFIYNFTASESENYILSYETSNAKETRLYFNVVKENIKPNCPVLDEVHNNNSNSYLLNWTEATDPDGTIEHYNLFEGKNPSIVTDEINSLSNWNFYKFSIASSPEPGHSQSSCIAPFPFHNINAFIESKYPVLIAEGDNLEFNINYDIENYEDFLLVKIAEVGKPYKQLAMFTGSNNGWEPQSINLVDYVGKQVTFKFTYKTNGQNLGQGVYIDDISPIKTYGSTQLIEEIAETTYAVSGNSTAVYEYGVEAIDNYGDKSRLSNLISVNVENIGIEDKTEANNFAMFPNPAKDRITINCPVGAKITFYNMVGQAVLEKNIASGQTTINTESLPRGCYFLKVEGNNFRKVKKLILE